MGGLSRERASLALPVETSTKLVAFTLPWRPRPERAVRTVVVKATCELVAGQSARLLDETDPPSGDVHVEGELARSVVYPSDFALRKPRADVTLSGTAYPAIGRGPTIARLSFGDRAGARFDRAIAVFGARRWAGGALGVRPTESAPFASMPLVHENAFGGPGYDANPVGMGVGGGPLPHLEDPDALLASPSSRPPPACFAPIPMFWRPRWSKLGTYGRDWQERRFPGFAEDFDFAFFQSAPEAQQLEVIDADASFALLGMRADGSAVSGRLPGLRPRAFCERSRAAGSSFDEVRLVLDTVHFDVDAMRVHLAYRGLLEVADDEARDVASIFVALDEPGRAPMGLDEARGRLAALRSPPEILGESPEAATTQNDNGARAAAMARSEARLRARLAAEGLAFVAAGDGTQSTPPPAPTATPFRPELCPVRRRVVAVLASGDPLDGGDFQDGNLDDLDFAGRSLVGANLKGASLRRARLVSANLSGALLAKADLSLADLSGAQLDLADLTGARLNDTKLEAASLRFADLSCADGRGAVLRGSQAERASFARADLCQASFEGASLPSADFTGATLHDARFDRAVAPEIRLYGARGARTSFREAELGDARAEGAALPEASFDGARGDGGVWDGASLDAATFRGARLRDVSLCDASCVRASFAGADLRRGRFARAALGEASFLAADLMEAQLEAADLGGADLRGASLYGAETFRARLDGARLEGAFLASTKVRSS
jgi:uncharacterized protein YjbI with pentapeptide repeats